MERSLEIACFNLQSALIAQAAGADRVEFCNDYYAGGISPSHEQIIEARKKITVGLHVIIRPRRGNFIYSGKEIEDMKATILLCKEIQVDGVVLGALNKDNTINLIVCERLISAAKPMNVTFHRAIDLSKNIYRDTEQLIDLGCDKILSSGGYQTALEGIAVLSRLQQLFGNKIVIMPGGSIRSSNLHEIMIGTGCNDFHSAAITDQANLPSESEIGAMKLIIQTQP